MILAPLAEAPVLPEVPLAAAGLGVLAFYVVMFGLKNGYAHSLGALLYWLAEQLRHVRFVGGYLAGKVDAINNNVEQALASGLAGAETAVGKWWYWQKQLAVATYDSLAWFATATLDGFTNLVEGTIPHMTTGAVRPVANELGKLRAALEATAVRLERELVHRATALEAQLEHDFGRAWKGIDHLRTTIPVGLGARIRGIEADVGTLEHKVSGVIPHRLTRLERYLGAGVIGGAAVVALTRVFPYWQCSNVGRFNRALCRSPLTGLEDFLALAFAAEIIGNLPALVRAMQAVAEETTRGLHDLAGV